jgi:hypothetical protein
MKVNLNKEQSDALQNMPESGMGYQFVDIVLKNGQKIEKQIAINASFLKTKDDLLFDANDIASITLHRD